jgi:hypothetical protein
VRDWTEEGTGEPNRAVDSLRGTDCEMDCESAGELRPESLDDEGTASGFDDSGESFAMAAVRVTSVAWYRAPRCAASNQPSVIRV